MRQALVPMLSAVTALSIFTAAGANPAKDVTIRTRYDQTMTLKDLANQVTINEILQHKGSKLIKAELYPPCPGFGGLQIFHIRSGKTNQTVEIAFSALSGHVVTARYARPAGSRPSKEAEGEMKTAVCNTGLGL
jgi:hypothetical protein